MRLIDELRKEHLLIERVAGSLLTFAELRRSGEAGPADGAGFFRFFQDFSGGYHHAREEEILFPALVAHAELPAGRGPVASLTLQHRRMAATLETMAPLLLVEQPEATSALRLGELAATYVRALWQHIDAENSVLLPEGEERLRRVGVLELAGRDATSAETDARGEGERLAAIYVPSEDPGAIRGEGCIICPSYGETCEGLEREWWTEWEWEDFRARTE